HGVVLVAHDPVMVQLADQVLALPAPVARARVRGRSPAGPRPTAPPDGPPPAPPGTPTRIRFWDSTLLAALASASGVALTATAGWLIVQASTRPAILTLLVAIVSVRTFGLARPALRYVERLRSHDVVLRMLAERRVEVYDAVVPLTPGALGRRRGDVLAAIVDDVDSVLDRELRVRMPVRGAVVVAVLAVAVGAIVEPWSVPVLAGTCLLAGGSGYLLARVGATRAERRAVATRARLSDAVVEVTQTASELTMWQAEGRALAAVGAISDELGRAAVAAATWLAWARAVVLSVSGAGVAAMAWLLAPLVADGSLSGPMLALLVLMPLALAEVATSVADAGALSARTEAAEARLARIAATPPAVAEPEHPVPADGDDEVGLDRVWAAWEDRVVLEDLTLDLRPGDRVAVVGPTGSGKSTLASLLLRFVDPVRGSVHLGKRPLRDLALDDVRRTVGLVDDDPHVFATTLAENVRLARPGATDAEVEDALRRARLGDWLDSLPAGLDSWLGDGHAGVSGGERARIAIARSLLADQPVLVLDEPAAHLDGATAEALAAEVLGGHEGRTVLWITHADAGLDRVERVLDLGAGRTRA
ncbi:thiol reductant ABC exporter subunit CydC, partial [Nocardioides sp.]|uniref:thiol reductant ABC exporter subunit CydC n=1 Tax=Nocardioides sp. TaxID=35761 RepID=UPI002EDBB35E